MLPPGNRFPTTHLFSCLLVPGTTCPPLFGLCAVTTATPISRHPGSCPPFPSWPSPNLSLNPTQVLSMSRHCSCNQSAEGHLPAQVAGPWDRAGTACISLMAGWTRHLAARGPCTHRLSHRAGPWVSVRCALTQPVSLGPRNMTLQQRQVNGENVEERNMFHILVASTK